MCSAEVAMVKRDLLMTLRTLTLNSGPDSADNTPVHHKINQRVLILLLMNKISFVQSACHYPHED